MDDLISRFRDYQIEWLTAHNDIEFCEEEEKLVIGFLKDTAESFMRENQSAQQWIPCDERLPEINHNVLISTVYGQVKEADFIGFDVESQPKWVSHGCLYWAEEVLRWMPLPEPYKGEENG